MLTDEFFIKECIELAKKGVGKVSPNPLVGCVVVKDGMIISSGYHSGFGKEHAEVNALKNVKEIDLIGSTVYVNLEPCSIYGKTPPCTDLLISKKIAKVVCGTKDPNPLINGNGVRRLRKAGIDVKVGVLEDECKTLNEKFYKFIKTGIPFVTVKVAQTLDAKISSGKNDKNKITCLQSRKYVHKLRMEHDAILVGSGTIKTDNPFLTLRHVRGNQPYRIILNSSLDINLNSHVFSDEFSEKTILFVSNKVYKDKLILIQKLISKGVRVYPLKPKENGLFDLKMVLKIIGKLGISSILVEGGSKIFSEFITQKLFDSLLIFIAPKILGKGIPVIDTNSVKLFSGLEFSKFAVEMIGEDILYKASVK
jgi:diaminohydroxyphosphoribosylaminopyrimidine deaminase / 5-amino-6-(5-phosphoribosylamino)uracil reductase